MKRLQHYMIFTFCFVANLTADEVSIYRSSGHQPGLESFELKASLEDGIRYTIKGEKIQRATTKEAKSLSRNIIDKLIALELTDKEKNADRTLPISTIPTCTIEVTKGTKKVVFTYKIGSNLKQYVEDYYTHLERHLKRHPNNFIDATETDVKSLYKKHNKIRTLVEQLIKTARLKS